MDIVVLEITDEGRVRYADGEWATPTLQERRAILYAARNAIQELTEAIDVLERRESR
jgi:acyl-CoA reductase-like NAD-dependent aldehyde dehydrogenase